MIMIIVIIIEQNTPDFVSYRSYINSPTELTVRLGIHDTSAPGGQILGISRLVVHCDFELMTFDNDIALLELATPAVFTNNVNPICLPHHHDISTGTHCHIAGWGYTSKNYF